MALASTLAARRAGLVFQRRSRRGCAPPCWWRRGSHRHRRHAAAARAAGVTDRPDSAAGAVEVVLACAAPSRGGTVVDVRTTSPSLAYGSVLLVELPLLLEAVLADSTAAGPLPVSGVGAGRPSR